MASFLNAELPSDDEADEDFNPTLAPEDNEGASKRSKLTVGLPDGESTHTKTARKARVDALWQQLSAKCAPPKRAKTGQEAATEVSEPGRGPWAARVLYASNCGVSFLTKMRGGQAGKRNSRLSFPTPVQQSTKPATKEAEQPSAAGATEQSADEQDRRRRVAAAALAAAKAAAAASASRQYGMPQVTEVRRFAGQEVTVTRAARPAEAARASAGAEPAPERPRGGMDAVLASLSGPKKVTVLDKTRSDWTEFKSADADIDAELEAHKRSAGQARGALSSGLCGALLRRTGLPEALLTPRPDTLASLTVPGEASLLARGGRQTVRSGARSETAGSLSRALSFTPSIPVLASTVLH